MNTLLLTQNLSKNQEILLFILMGIGVLLFFAMLFSIIAKISVALTYRKYNKVNTKKGLDAKQLSRQNLDNLGLENINVKKVGFFRALIGLNMQGYGNSYSHYKKSVFLRKNIIDKSSITAYAVSTQRVAHAKFDSENKHSLYYKIKPLLIFAPVLFIPIILLGVLLDTFVLNTILGPFSLVTSILSLALFITSFVIIFITIPIEIKANKKAEEILKQFEMVTDEEMIGIQKVNKAYIISYVADFIYALLQIIWDIVRIALQIANKTKN